MYDKGMEVVSMETINLEKFGSFVSELRKAQGLTQKDLGERLFVTDKTVSKWERGLSLPNVSLLLPLSEALGVTVTELLRSERTQTETLSVNEVEHLLTRSIQFSSKEETECRQERKKWIWRFALCIPLCIGQLFGMVLLGYELEPLSYTVFLVEVLMLIFGGWFCIGTPDTLPAYYDAYKIDYITDGIFKLHVTGLYFNNRNWPHIVNACRRYCLITALSYPGVYALLHHLFGWNQGTLLPDLFLTLVPSLSMIIVIYYIGKKYA